MSKICKEWSRNHDGRACFMHNGNMYVSAGIIPFSFHQGKIYYLMSYRTDKNYLEDLGGKSNPEDKKLVDVALREYHEETRGTQAGTITADMLKVSIPIPSSKYMIYLAPVEADISQELGICHESGTDYDRCLMWLTKSQIGSKRLSPRLKDLVRELR